VAPIVAKDAIEARHAGVFGHLGLLGEKLPLKQLLPGDVPGVLVADGTAEIRRADHRGGTLDGDPGGYHDPTVGVEPCTEDILTAGSPVAAARWGRPRRPGRPRPHRTGRDHVSLSSTT